MSEKPMKKHGTFSWNELMSTDIQAAKTFYGELFGWQFTQLAVDCDYLLAQVDGADVAGIMPKPPEADKLPATWMGYLTVDDVDRQVERVASLGGKVVAGPRDIPDVGRFAVISDPQGAMLPIITYLDQ